MYITGNFSAKFNIRSGNSVKEVGQILAKNRLIIDTFTFPFIVRLLNADKSLKSGDYSVEHVENIFQLLSVLQNGVPEKQIKVTIPEGYTAADITKTLKEKDIISNDKEFFKKAIKYEGFLFPDTYFFLKGEDSDKIIQTMKKRFYSVLPDSYEKQVKKKGLSLYQAVILASIVEKEAKFDEDRPLVASVFLNRLRVGMPLQSDATINYVLKDKKLWLSDKDLKIDSPYNTYTHTGLPPTPICNPGLKSLIAVANAPNTDYFYFLTTKSGKAIFERTLAEHNRDIRKYYGP
jgi:UPF0755 protein